MMIAIVLLAVVAIAVATPLDDYIKKPDPSFKWKVINKFQPDLFDVDIYNIELTSQQWLNASDSNIHTWRHWLQVCVPKKHRQTDYSFLYIDGGHDPLDLKNPPTVFDPTTPLVAPFICEASQTICSTILQIPNEPARFPADYPVPNKRRTEDAIIAYTWRHYINGSSPEWLLRLPMTKAVVRAMDVVQTFGSTFHKKGVPPIKKFVVAGASKRGWTTWTAMAVDDRIKAAAPIVMPIPNMIPNMNHQYRLYGGWSFALDDYIHEELMGWLNLPGFQAIEDIVGPYTYFDRYKRMPKFVIAATGDEFFDPDSPSFFWDKLPGPKLLNMVPDAEHSLATGIIDVANAVSAFYYLQIQGLPLPEYSWKMTKSNGTSASGYPAKIEVTVGKTSLPYLKSVQMWKATTLSTTQRDFRLIKCRDLAKGGCFQPVFWWPTTLHPTAPGKYVAESDVPTLGGWNGFNVELIFEYQDVLTQRNHTLTVTSEVNVTPDRLPFAACPASECACGAKCPPPPAPVAAPRYPTSVPIIDNHQD